MPLAVGSQQKTLPAKKSDSDSPHSALTVIHDTVRKCLPIHRPPTQAMDVGQPTAAIIRVGSAENVSTFSLNSINIRRTVTPEQIFRWESSFAYLLNDQNGLALFENFLKTEYSQENIQFWKACQRYRRLPAKLLEAEAQNIYQLYLSVQSPREVNLDAKTRLRTISLMQTPSPHLFESAQRKIQALMEKDSYPRFLRSEYFNAFKQSVIHRKHSQKSEDYTASDSVLTLLVKSTALPFSRKKSG